MHSLQKEAVLSHVWNFNHLQIDKLFIQQKQELEKPDGDTVVNNFNVCVCAHECMCACVCTPTFAAVLLYKWWFLTFQMSVIVCVNKCTCALGQNCL